MDSSQLLCAIFDMDGLLIDSEPLWHEAEIEILGDLGVPLGDSECRTTKGMVIYEVADFWFARYPWNGATPKEVAVQVVDKVIELIQAKGTMKPGVIEVLEACQQRSMRIGLASSSEYRLIKMALEHFGIQEFFEVIYSAEEEPFGKPHPGVFLTAAKKLGADPTSCVVFEDSPAGVLSAKAARMACVAVPEMAEKDRPAFGIADLVLDSLVEMNESRFDEVSHLVAPLP